MSRMEWPSKNVPYGGMLHPPKASYSPETHKFLKLLMDESKMSMMQRKKVNYYLRNGEPLPTFNNNRSTKSSSNIPEVLIRPGSSKRRSRETILNSGAFEKERYIPKHPPVDREKEKQKLQDKMAFNKHLNVKSVKQKSNKKADEKGDVPNRFDQLVEEIKEREQFLKEMEELGEGNKYRPIIQQQIEAKVREMRELK